MLLSSRYKDDIRQMTLFRDKIDLRVVKTKGKFAQVLSHPDVTEQYDKRGSV